MLKLGTSTIQAGGAAPSAGSNVSSLLVFAGSVQLGSAGIYCALGSQASSLCAGRGFSVFSVCWNGSSVSSLCTGMGLQHLVLVHAGILFRHLCSL